jgi:hypothetical protein
MIVGLGLALASIVSIGPPETNPRLEWEAPLECPDQRWAADRVEAYLGRPLADETDVHVVLHVRAQAAGFVLDLATDAGGVRDRQQLVHHDCAALVEIAASLAAISIDPLAIGLRVDALGDPVPDWAPDHALRNDVARPATQTPTLPSVPDSPPPPVSSPPVSSPPVSSPLPGSPLSEQPLLVELYADPDFREADRDDPYPSPRTQVSIGASAGLALELFPNPAPEVHGNIAISRGRARTAFRAELVGGAILAGRFRSADGLAGGNLLAWDMGLRPCGVPRWGIVELRICAAVGAGQIRARGINVEPALLRAHPWLWVSPEVGLAFALSDRWALFVDLGANFNVYRPVFSISNPDAEFVTPVASARTRLGIELRFF